VEKYCSIRKNCVRPRSIFFLLLVYNFIIPLWKFIFLISELSSANTFLELYISNQDNSVWSRFLSSWQGFCPHVMVHVVSHGPCLHIMVHVLMSWSMSSCHGSWPHVMVHVLMSQLLSSCQGFYPHLKVPVLISGFYLYCQGYCPQV
jgi:hypothetical protein